MIALRSATIRISRFVETIASSALLPSLAACSRVPAAIALVIALSAPSSLVKSVL